VSELISAFVNNNYSGAALNKPKAASRLRLQKSEANGFTLKTSASRHRSSPCSHQANESYDEQQDRRWLGNANCAIRAIAGRKASGVTGFRTEIAPAHSVADPVQSIIQISIIQ
jgi:hypothetical protein